MWVDPAVRRVRDGVKKAAKADGSIVETPLYKTIRLTDEIGLPMRAQKPTIIEAVGKALEEQVFDALGMAPSFRSTSADPIIAGQIRRPDGGVLTFLVAWWLDPEDL